MPRSRAGSARDPGSQTPRAPPRGRDRYPRRRRSWSRLVRFRQTLDALLFHVALQPLQSLRFVGERAVELRFVGGANHLTDVRACASAEIRKHMPPEDQRALRLMSYLFGRSRVADTSRALRQTRRQRRSTRMVGFHQANQLGDAGRRETRRQTTHAAGSDIAPDTRVRQMIFDQWNHLIDDSALDTDAG